MRRTYVLAMAGWLAANLAGSQGQSSNLTPVQMSNCGVAITVREPPARAVTMNQAATEVMLALGLQERLVGTAYLDDQILPEFAAAYARIPVLATRYPSRESLLAARPDFVYAAYSSAFAAPAAGSRADLAGFGAGSYVSPSACAVKTRPPGVTLDLMFSELRDIAQIFGVAPRAEALIQAYSRTLADVRQRIGTVNKPLKVFWYDSEDPPKVGACCGMPNETLRLVGAENIFKDTPGTWTTVNWEAVVARNPDVIVLANATWSTANEKRRALLQNKALASVEAVKHQRFVAIDFSDTTPGIRNVETVRKLAAALYPDRFR